LKNEPKCQMKLFHDKFREVIQTKSNRIKVFQFLQDLVQQTVQNVQKQQELLYFYLYEIHVEWSTYPRIEDFFLFVKQKKIGYHHHDFDLIRQEIDEEENFIMCPPVIDEGVIECKRCKSKRTFSFNRQTRSSDEAVTVFVRCVNCGHQFRM